MKRAHAIFNTWRNNKRAALYRDLIELMSQTLVHLELAWMISTVTATTTLLYNFPLMV